MPLPGKSVMSAVDADFQRIINGYTPQQLLKMASVFERWAATIRKQTAHATTKPIAKDFWKGFKGGARWN